MKNFLWAIRAMLTAAVLSACQTGDGPPPGAASASGEPLAAQSGMEAPPDAAPSDTIPAPAEAPGASAPRGTAAKPAPPERTFVFERPENVRGLYLNAWVAGSQKPREALIALAGRTEINSFVIDIKDASGYVSHPSGVPLAQAIGATDDIRIPNLSRLLGQLEEAGIYPIARIVIVKDPLLAAARPDLAIQDSAGGVWRDGKEVAWMNPYQRDVWEYHVALAREVAAWGFPEIQWDYVRFPDASPPEMERARFPGNNGQSRADAIRGFLKYSRDALADTGVRVTADVFGVTTTATSDVGIGQRWESFIDVVDVALPMIYPSHYWKGSFNIDAPNAYPYEIVRAALRDVARRSAAIPDAGGVRPWLQDFSLGDPPYGAAEVRAQIQATYDAGIDEWILWNAGGRYTEEALEPLGGFTDEPLLRIANRLVPASQRHEPPDTTIVFADENLPTASDTTDVLADKNSPTASDTTAVPADENLPEEPDTTAAPADENLPEEPDTTAAPADENSPEEPDTTAVPADENLPEEPDTTAVPADENLPEASEASSETVVEPPAD